MKTTKPLIEMTAQELREEVGRLTTLLDRVHRKNRARKRALKDINRSVLLKNKEHADAIRLNMSQRQMVYNWKARAERAEETMAQTARNLDHVSKLAVGYEAQLEILKRRHGYELERDDNKLVPEKKSIFFRFTKHLRGQA